MKSVAMRLLCVSAVLASFVVLGGAQERSATPSSPDPRVGLKGGFRDAGEAARNMELIATLPKPDGFFDPKAPAGNPTPPERPPTAPGSTAPGSTAPGSTAPGSTAPSGAAAAAGGNPAPSAAGEPSAAGGSPTAAAGNPPATPSDPTTPGGTPRPPTQLGFANSDLAFSRNRMFIGNYHGFNTYDIDSSKRPRLMASVVCPGGQGDVSIYGNLLFMSVEQTRGRIDCGVQGVQDAVSTERFRGIRIFDISDVRKPKQVAAVQTCRGSHTHTLVTDPDDKANLYVYGSGTSSVRSGEELTGCSGLAPDKDPNTSLFSIDVIQVPLAAPQKARIVNRPRIFADPATGAISGLWQGGSHGPGTQTSRMTNQCHDITVFPEVGLAAGACSGNGILLDISDPVNPVRLDHVVDKSFAYWHSATFNIDGTKVVFTDEWGGGSRPRCRATDPPTWGADAIFDIVDRKMRFAGYYKLPAPQTDQENCVAHNGSLIPVPGRDLMVQGWYQGGISVFDFTDSTKPVEIAFFDRGPIDPAQLRTGGYWSAYWYNGHIYGSEIARGVDVFTLTPSDQLSQNEIEAASLVRVTELNTQHQKRVAWPATTVVARAYLDQLTRSNGIQPARAAAVKAALDRADKRPGRADVEQLEKLATQLESDAGAADGRDAVRLRSLAASIKARTAKLRR